MRTGHELRAVMPAARYLEIPSGHLPHYERPDHTNPAILQFLADHASPQH